MVAFEQFGLQNISRVSPAAKEACDFSSLLVIQPINHIGLTVDDALLHPLAQQDYDAQDALDGYFTYPLVVQAGLLDDHVELLLTYDPAVLTEPRLQALSYHFEHTVQLLLGPPDSPLTDLSLTSDWDVKQAQEWNGERAPRSSIQLSTSLSPYRPADAQTLSPSARGIDH